jgi:hypothetical protein
MGRQAVCNAYCLFDKSSPVNGLAPSIRSARTNSIRLNLTAMVNEELASSLLLKSRPSSRIPTKLCILAQHNFPRGHVKETLTNSSLMLKQLVPSLV